MFRVVALLIFGQQLLRMSISVFVHFLILNSFFMYTIMGKPCSSPQTYIYLLLITIFGSAWHMNAPQ
jgi:hypothetical protein